MDERPCWRSVSCVFQPHVRSEPVEERFNDQSLSQQQPVEYWHQVVPHVPAHAGDPMQASFPQPCEEGFGIWPLSANSFPSSPATIFSRGSRSSVLPAVILIAINAPLWFITTCGLNPGNRPIVERPRAAGPLKVRLRGMRGLAQTASPVLSAIWMPVPSPQGEWIRTQNGAKGRGINATNRPYEGSSPKQSRYFCSTPYRRKCLKSLNGGRWNSTMVNSIPAGDSLPCRRRLRVAGISRCRSRSSGVSAKSSRQHNSAVADRHMGGIARVGKNTILNHTRRGRGRPPALSINSGYCLERRLKNSPPNSKSPYLRKSWRGSSNWTNKVSFRVPSCGPCAGRLRK